MMSLFKSFQVVSTPDDRYDLVKNRRNPIENPSQEVINRYQTDLDQLASVLRDTEFAWYLEGGMAIAAHLGRFYRRHSDTDVGVFLHDIPALERLLARHDYGLFSRNPGIKSLEYARMDLIRETSAGEILSDKRVKRLTAIKTDGNGRAVASDLCLPRFDIHVHRRGRRDDCVYVTYKQHAFPADLFDSHGFYTTSSGCTIRVASASFLYFFKLLGQRPKERFDRQLIERFGLISPLQANRVRAAVVNRLGKNSQILKQLKAPRAFSAEFAKAFGASQ